MSFCWVCLPCFTSAFLSVFIESLISLVFFFFLPRLFHHFIPAELSLSLLSLCIVSFKLHMFPFDHVTDFIRLIENWLNVMLAHGLKNPESWCCVGHIGTKWFSNGSVWPYYSFMKTFLMGEEIAARSWSLYRPTCTLYDTWAEYILKNSGRVWSINTPQFQ